MVIKQSVVNNIASNILYLRKLKGYTLSELAQKLSPGKSSLQNYEQGKSDPSLAIASEMASLFEVTIDDLANRDLKNNPRLNHKDLNKLSRHELEDRYMELLDKVTQVRRERSSLIKALNSL